MVQTTVPCQGYGLEQFPARRRTKRMSDTPAARVKTPRATGQFIVVDDDLTR
jgi:hypothetical protein